jgi:hypothetical protein
MSQAWDNPAARRECSRLGAGNDSGLGKPLNTGRRRYAVARPPRSLEPWLTTLCYPLPHYLRYRPRPPLGWNEEQRGGAAGPDAYPRRPLMFVGLHLGHQRKPPCQVP